VRVPCTGRVHPYFIIKSLIDGWDGVIVSGCHPGDCHYISGNLVARRRFAVLNDILEYFGIDTGRVNFMWVSAAEGERFAKLIKKATEIVKKLGPNNNFQRSW
jgi:coenzyme F420-reducing hydrogenase delta subunit